MKPTAANQPATKQRRIHSFVPDPDVAKMLIEARGQGFKLGWLVNTALRRHMPKKLQLK